MTQLLLDQIHTDGGTQARADLNQAAIEDYSEDMSAGATFPPVIVFYDGTDYWLADGFHRVEAAKRAGLADIAAQIVPGTRREAILHSAGANAMHGLRRTGEDKRRAVLRLLEDEEWSQWSDREVARRTNTTHPFVAKLRAGVTGNITSERTYTTKHGAVATMQTANIGKAQPKPEEPASAPAEPLALPSPVINEAAWHVKITTLENAPPLVTILQGEEMKPFLPPEIGEQVIACILAKAEPAPEK